VRRAATQVGIATLVVAIVGYVVQFLAARWLGPADYASFAVFWAVLFVVIACLHGLAQEVIRVARVAKLRIDAGGLPGSELSGNPRIVLVAVVLSAAVAVIVFISGFAWAPWAFGADWSWALPLLCIAAVVVGGGFGAVAVLAGFARWRGYSLLVCLEGVSRLGFFLFVALALPTVFGFSLAAVLAFVPGLIVALCWPSLRRDTFDIRSDAPLSISITRMLRAMAAAALSGILVIGWPALLSIAAEFNPRGTTTSSLGVLILLVTLTRAPIMVPLTSFQNALIARFTGFDHATRQRWVIGGVGIVLAASAVLAGLAALIGPPLMPIIFGPGFEAGAWIIAALTAASAGLGIITLTGVAALGAAQHNLYLLGWGTAIAGSVLALFLIPLPFEWATVAALVIGPLVGAAVHAVSLVRSVPLKPLVQHQD